MAKRITLENTGRQIWRFPVYRDVKTASGGVRKVVDHNQDLVIGCADDIPDDERSARCPSPVVTVSEEQLLAVGPLARRAIAAMVAKKTLRRTES